MIEEYRQERIFAGWDEVPKPFTFVTRNFYEVQACEKANQKPTDSKLLKSFSVD